jgi:hypothetical protein
MNSEAQVATGSQSRSCRDEAPRPRNLPQCAMLGLIRLVAPITIDYRHRGKVLWIPRIEPLKALSESLDKNVGHRALCGTTVMRVPHMSGP